MTLSRLWGWLAILLPVLASLIAGVSTVDLAYHLRAGGLILDGHGIPSTETWTFTAAGSSWLDQQWGAQAVLAAVDRLLGWSGLFVLRAALVGTLFGLVFATARLRGASIRRSSWLTLAAFFVSAVALALRPQLVAMVLFAATLALLAGRRSRPGLVWLAPVVVALWANVHGSFFLGPLAVGLAWLEDRADRVDRRDRLLVVAAVAGLATLANPFGLDVWRYAIALSTNADVTRRITEWQPATLRDVPGLLYFASVAAAAVVLARSGRSIPWPTLLWLGVFAAIGAYAVRGVAWWAIGAGYAIAPILATPGVPARPVPRLVARMNTGVVVLLGAAIVALLPWWRPIQAGTGGPIGVVADAPPGITSTLVSIVRPGDRILNPQPWGSWFELELPQATVAVDSRIEVLPATVWSDLERVAVGTSGWQDVLARWAPTIAVLGPADTDLDARLTALGWRETYHDTDGRVLVAPGRAS